VNFAKEHIQTVMIFAILKQRNTKMEIHLKMGFLKLD